MAQLLLIVLLFVANSLATHKDFKVYEVVPKNLNEFKFIDIFHHGKYDFWKEGRHVGEPSDIMVAPENQLYFERALKEYGIHFDVVVEDVERILEEEKIDRLLSHRNFQLGQVSFNTFLTLNEQMVYLNRLVEDYPDIASLEIIGQSYEGKDIPMIKISSGLTNDNQLKPAIFIDAGIHCREWIAPPVALYAIHQLVENSSNAFLYENIDWYIVPNLNPDGYEFTYNSNRLWRKNRRLTEGAACYGTDLNRNFGYCWMCGGASSNSCSETYAGPEAFSEPEARALRDAIVKYHETIKLYLSFHSFGNLLLYPWSFAELPASNSDELYQLGRRSVDAIEAASEIGSVYYINNSAIGLYIASGVTTDWVAGAAGVQLSYIFELPAADSPFWFMIPARQILPVVRETWAGIVAMYEYINEQFGP